MHRIFFVPFVLRGLMLCAIATTKSERRVCILLSLPNLKFECMHGCHSNTRTRENPCKYACVQDFDAAVTDLKVCLLEVIEEEPS